ncbi:MAG: bifunctional nuclease family protein [Candidatus Zixiibacteriota bacterium]
MIEAKVEGMALDLATNSPVVILAPISLMNKVLPIWIGHHEAWGIAMHLSGVAAKRPMTWDLMKTVIDSLSATVERVEITELHEATFYARLCLARNGEKFNIDARPSDSIAVAVRTGARIFVNEELFNLDLREAPDESPPLPNDPETLRDRLRKINPEDFGKYNL